MFGINKTFFFGFFSQPKNVEHLDKLCSGNKHTEQVCAGMEVVTFITARLGFVADLLCFC